MYLNNLNEIYADFILTYAKKDGLNSLVTKIKLDESKTMIQADLQPDLIDCFSTKFPEADLKDLDIVIEWILCTAIANRSSEQKNER